MPAALKLRFVSRQSLKEFVDRLLDTADESESRGQYRSTFLNTSNGDSIEFELALPPHPRRRRRRRGLPK